MSDEARYYNLTGTVFDRENPLLSDGNFFCCVSPDDAKKAVRMLNAPTVEPKAVDENELNSSEAIMAFLAWLTTRENSVTFGANEECSVAVELFTEFTDHNNMPEVRDNYTNNFTMPKALDEKLEKRVINPIGDKR